MTEWQAYEKAELKIEPNTPSLDIRERMLRFGSGSISNLDLVVAILGSGVPGKPVRRLAKEVLNQITKNSDSCDLDELMLISGMGEAKSCAVAAALELGRRIFSTRGTRIGMPKDAYPLLIHFADIRQEHFIVISLNGGHEVNAIREVTKGLINKTVVHPREVFKAAILANAASIILAHNHPSGSLEAGTADREVTRRIRAAGDLLGISLDDHIIISSEGFSRVEA